MGLTSFSESCTENDIQLNSGLLQICHESQWGLVCINPYLNNLNKAKVVCQQLGFPSRGKIAYVILCQHCMHTPIYVLNTQMLARSFIMYYILMVLLFWISLHALV